MAEFPILFRVEDTDRHEVMLVTSTYTVDDLKFTMDGLIATSANCAEFMGKYRGTGVTDNVMEIKARWAAEGNDKELLPKETLLTDDNCRAVLAMMAASNGKHVFVVKVRTSGDSSDVRDTEQNVAPSLWLARVAPIGGSEWVLGGCLIMQGYEEQYASHMTGLRLGVHGSRDAVYAYSRAPSMYVPATGSVEIDIWPARLW